MTAAIECNDYPIAVLVNRVEYKKHKKRSKGKVHPCTGTEALYRPYGP